MAVATPCMSLDSNVMSEANSVLSGLALVALVALSLPRGRVHWRYGTLDRLVR